MPFISHWKYNDDNHYDSIQCRKGEPDTISTKERTFCYYDSQIDDRLEQLHAQQRAGNRDVKREIDRYLVSCSHHIFFEMVLPKNCIPHYNNLPDIYKYTVGILDSSMDSNDDIQQVLLLVRQCIPLRRRTKRAQREVQWKYQSHFSIQTLIRCLQGTLLGLYPTSLTQIAFGAKMGIYCYLRTLLVQTFDTTRKAIQQIGYIIKIGIMEHLCNIIPDYYPGVNHTLNQSGQKVEYFCNSVSTICDIFRGELNTLYCSAIQKNQIHVENSIRSMDYSGKRDPLFYAKIFLSIIPQLEKVAHSYFERCTRAYRGIIIGNTTTLKHVDLAKKMLNTDIISNINKILQNTYSSSNVNIFDMIHHGKICKEFIPFAWHMSHVIKIYPLPLCIREQQLLALSRRYGGDTSCMEKCRLLNVCIICVIKKGGAYGMRLRHDCQNNDLLCVHCDKGSVVSIECLGNMVCIGNDKIILSSCCGTFIHYGGSGFDFCTSCGIQCTHQRHFFRKRDRCYYSLLKSPTKNRKNIGQDIKKHVLLSASDPYDKDDVEECQVVKPSLSIHHDPTVFNSRVMKTSVKQKKHEMLLQHKKYERYQTQHMMVSTCEICEQKNIYQTIRVLDISKRQMTTCSLCSKHVIPSHITKYIYEKNDIQKYFTSGQLYTQKSKLASPDSPLPLKKRKLKDYTVKESEDHDSLLPNRSIILNKNRRGRKKKINLIQ